MRARCLTPGLTLMESWMPHAIVCRSRPIRSSMVEQMAGSVWQETMSCRPAASTATAGASASLSLMGEWDAAAMASWADALRCRNVVLGTAGASPRAHAIHVAIDRHSPIALTTSRLSRRPSSGRVAPGDCSPGAPFPHPVLREMVSLREGRKRRRQQRVVLKKSLHRVPGEAPLRAAAQPTPPPSRDPMQQRPEPSPVALPAKVRRTSTSAATTTIGSG